VVSSGQSATVFKWPWESVAIVPTTVQRLQFVADQITREKVGVKVTGLAHAQLQLPRARPGEKKEGFPRT
jgi:hypothetical protein